jgi:hypothetical protein
MAQRTRQRASPNNSIQVNRQATAGTDPSGIRWTSQSYPAEVLHDVVGTAVGIGDFRRLVAPPATISARPTV